MVFVAGWAVVRAHYCAFPAFLDYVHKEYIDKHTYWFSGASPPGIPAATPSEPNLNMFNSESEHRMSTFGKIPCQQDFEPRRMLEWAFLHFSLAVSRFQIRGYGKKVSPFTGLPRAAGDALFFLRIKKSIGGWSYWAK